MYRSEAGGASSAGGGAWLERKTKNDVEKAYRNNSHWIVPAEGGEECQYMKRELCLGDDDDDVVTEKENPSTTTTTTTSCTRYFYGNQSKFADCLVDVPGPSNRVAYYDAASLYPSSGKKKKNVVIGHNLETFSLSLLMLKKTKQVRERERERDGKDGRGDGRGGGGGGGVV